MYPLVGEWNHLEASIGARGMGKSTEQCVRARELVSIARGAYVIGHSLGARLPLSPPPTVGGPAYPIVYHQSLDKLERGLRRFPGKWHILAPPLFGDSRDAPTSHSDGTADALLQFAIRLSTQLRKAAWNKAHPFKLWNPNVNYTGIRCPPIIVIIDEGVAIDSASVGKKDKNSWFFKFIFSVRHLHIALLYAIQNSNARNWQILEQSTIIRVFAVKHEWALNSLRAAGATPDELERIRTQGRYQYVTLTALDIKTLETSSKNVIPE